jgi:8-oxo-dGTP pyrophosphatase MutT (NUDIX family)
VELTSAVVEAADVHRRPLLELLAVYRPFDEDDAAARERIAAFVEAEAQCFERSLSIGHVTGSAWIVDRARTRCLLTHHRKLGRWLQPGGHADGDADILAVARREAAEESGLRSLAVASPAVFDCDVHAIPARGSEPQHWHYDVRFLFAADSREPPVVSDESHDVAWVDLADVARLAPEASVLRMVAKSR